jgi:subtilase family serine protease
MPQTLALARKLCFLWNRAPILFASLKRMGPECKTSSARRCANFPDLNGKIPRAAHGASLYGFRLVNQVLKKRQFIEPASWRYVRETRIIMHSPMRNLFISNTRWPSSCRILTPVREALPRFLLLLATVLASSAALQAQVPDQIARTANLAQVRALPNHHPLWASAGNDMGAASPSQTLENMTLVLTRSSQQEQAFQQFLADQQNPASPDYHRWLTPAQVGERFGLSDNDIQTLTSWLQSEGLHVNWVSPSRIFIGFGGPATAVGSAFHTEMHNYKVNGVERMSVNSDPMIPAALFPAIKAVRGLYSITDHPTHQSALMQSASPDLSDGGSYFITPGDFNTIYDVPSTYNGSGETIGIVSWSRVDLADLDNFRSLTGTSFSDPSEVVPTAYGGKDPGAACTTISCSSSQQDGQQEATLDVIRSGSVAQGASLLLVVSSSSGSDDGIGADAQYLVHTTPVPVQVMSISFGECESVAGQAGVEYWDSLFQVATSEGISVFVSSDDSGAAGCDSAFSTPPRTAAANSPNYICSSSYATCVGGTEFNDAGNYSAYWSSANSSNLASALSYIPEGGWNESTSTSVAASGGGISSDIATPTWQIGVTGVPTADAGRYTPDIAFSASCRDGYFACMAAAGGSCVAGSNNQFSFIYFCGTSAAAPGMAGIAALLDQKQGAAQGNLNPEMYQLESNEPSVFHDVTVASSGVTSCSVSTASMCNNSIAGRSGGSTQAGYLVGTGYDEITGLGSLDVRLFLNNFGAIRTTPSVTVSPSPASITTAQADSVTVTVSGGGSNPTPTGSITLTSGTYSSAATTLSGGHATISISAGSLATGTDTLAATYTPDAASSTTYNSTSGTNTVIVTVASKITPTVTVSPSPASITTVQSDSVTVTVSGGGSNPTPTGSVTLTSGAYTSAATVLSGGSTILTIPADTLPAGTDTLAVAYTPDASSSITYNTAAGSNTVGVSKVAPTVTVTPSPASITTVQALQVTITVSDGGSNPTPTGSVTLTSGTYNSTAITLSAGSAVINIPAETLPAATDTLSVTYAPDSASSPTYSNAAGSNTVGVSKVTPTVTVTPSPISVTTAQADSVTVAVSGGSGTPTATGSVTLTNGSYSSGAVTLSGGSATISISAGSLATGTDTLAAAYTPDSTSSPIYNGATGANTVLVTSLTKITPSVTVSPSPASITTTQSDSVTVTVNGGGSNPTPTGSVILTSGSYSSGAVTLSGSTIINIPAGDLAVGTDTLTAIYTPDTNGVATYNSAMGSNTVGVTTPLVPTFTISGTSVTVTSGATSGNTSTITITPVNGFTGSVTLTAQITSSPSGAVNLPTFSFSPNPVSISSANPVNPILTISTSAPTIGALTYPKRPTVRWLAEGGAALTCLLLFWIPGRRRNLRVILGMVALLVVFAGNVVACGGSASITGGNTGGTGVAPTVATNVASAISSSSATLGGTVNPNGSDTHAWFLYGTSSILSGATSTTSQDIGSGTSGTAISATVSGLTTGKTYYFQAVAQNSTGTNYGSIVPFSTSSPGTTAGSYTITVTGTSGSTVVTGAVSLNVE